MFRQRLLQFFPESVRENPSRLSHGIAAAVVLGMSTIAPATQALAAPKPVVAPAPASPLSTPFDSGSLLK